MSLLKLRVLIILVISFTSVASFAQTDSITLDQLQDCIRDRLSRSLDADMTELEYSKKGEWIKYLPNIGVTYTVAGQPRPAVSCISKICVLYLSSQSIRLRLNCHAARCMTVPAHITSGRPTRCVQRPRAKSSAKVLANVLLLPNPLNIIRLRNIRQA
jgi:hypothetical protein